MMEITTGLLVAVVGKKSQLLKADPAPNFVAMDIVSLVLNSAML
jgi:hypothetical protein